MLTGAFLVLGHSEMSIFQFRSMGVVFVLPIKFSSGTFVKMLSYDRRHIGD